MARRSSSSSSGAWRYLNPAYYLKRPKRLALLFFVFVAATFAFWDRQSLVSEYEVRPSRPAGAPLIRVVEFSDRDLITSCLALCFAFRFVARLICSWIWFVDNMWLSVDLTASVYSLLCLCSGGLLCSGFNCYLRILIRIL